MHLFKTQKFSDMNLDNLRLSKTTIIQKLTKNQSKMADFFDFSVFLTDFSKDMPLILVITF